MTSKAFCTFAVGPYQECLELARPTFQRYCDLHNYTYIEEVPNSSAMEDRPPAWGKVLILRDLLEKYDLVMWLDCDVLILDPSVDLASKIPSDKIQAISRHDTSFYTIPSTGLWYCTPAMIPYLNELWKMTKYINHVWWEQAALQELLGYHQDLRYFNPIPIRVHETDLYYDTYFFDSTWHSIDYTNLKSTDRIMHFPAMGIEERVERMRSWINEQSIYGESNSQR